MNWSPEMHVHLIGIGGTGLSAIARVLHERGFTVSGSDKQSNLMTAQLAKTGVKIYLGHHSRHIGNADAVIYTSAIDAEGRKELDSARKRDIATYRRSEVMQTIIGPRPTIAVAGTHGKTTTTAMIVHILRSCGMLPGFILGSTLASGENASSGDDDLFVVEADEYDNMFFGLRPETAIITNIEHDHPDFFPELNDVIDAFSRFSKQILSGGNLVYCADDPQLQTMIRGLRHDAALYSYGYDPSYYLQLVNCRMTINGSSAICFREGIEIAEIELSIVGEHNIKNAAAALLAAEIHDISIKAGAAALSNFSGVDRRLSLRGDHNGLAVLDDYAHHPTAIRASIRAARQQFPERQLVVVWEPHTYSRIVTLWEEFLVAFDLVDVLMVTEIYPAREDPIQGIDGATITKAIHHSHAYFIEDHRAALLKIKDVLEIPSSVLILSAGSASAIGFTLLSDWKISADI